MFDDEKIKIIEQSQDGILVIYVWVRLLALAGKKNEGGYIIIFPGVPTSVEHLASIMNKPIGIIAQALNVLIQTGLVSTDPDNGYLYITNWEKHQSIDKLERIREKNKERAQRFRDAQRMKILPENTKNNVTVTLRNAVDKESKIKESKKEEGDIKSVTHTPIFKDILNKYKPTDFTDAEKKERMVLVFQEMKKSDIRLEQISKEFGMSKQLLINHLKNWSVDRFNNDDTHHALNDFWFFFNTYLKKQIK